MAATEQPSSSVTEQNTSLSGLTAFQRDLLVVIAGGEDEDEDADVLYGLAIKEDLEEYYETEINHGRLYPNLDTLVEKGLVEKGQLDRRTNSYEITDKGIQELQAYRTRINDSLEETDE